MNKFIISLLLICCQQSILAQEVWYQSRYSSYYEYNLAQEQYDLQGQEWTTTRFSPNREYILIEFSPLKTTKIWWAKSQDSECYYTEADLFKICFKYDANSVNIYSNLDTLEHRYTSVWQLSKIGNID